MFLFTELHAVHIEITSRCQARCPMCARNYKGGISNPNLKISDWTLNEFMMVFDHKTLLQLYSIYFCGNFGDPLLNDDLIDMCKYAVSVNPKIQIRIHTNGSLRSTTWWKTLAKELPENHTVIFGIDGLEDTHHLYRIGTSYKQIIKNATSFINSGGNAEWVFIKFKHNEHQVHEAELIAKKLGFSSFSIKNSTRFLEPQHSVLDQDGNIEYYLEPPSNNEVILVNETMIKGFKKWVDDSNISCYVQKLKEIYIDANKHMYPCCYIASAPYSYVDPNSLLSDIKSKINSQYFDLVNDLGGIDRLNVLKNSIQDIINSSTWQTVWLKYWNDTKLITCAKSCGINKISKPQQQVIKKIDFD